MANKGASSSNLKLLTHNVNKVLLNTLLKRLMFTPCSGEMNSLQNSLSPGVRDGRLFQVGSCFPNLHQVAGELGVKWETRPGDGMTQRRNSPLTLSLFSVQSHILNLRLKVRALTRSHRLWVFVSFH